MSFFLQAPFSPAVQAAKLWNAPLPLCGPEQALADMIPKRSDDVGIPRKNNFGGLNPDSDAKEAVNYDPRTQLMRAPIEGETVLGLAHGPSAFVGGDTILSKVQYGLPKDVPQVLEPVVLQPRTKSCGCINDCLLMNTFTPFSMGTLAFSISNALTVRKMLIEAGCVVLSPEMAKERVYKCVCDVFGDENVFTQSLFNNAESYDDQPIITTPNPPQVLNLMNVRYVDKILDTLRTDSNNKLRYNFAQIEGNRAYLQEYPSYVDSTPQGDCYVEQQLRNPNANQRHLCVLGKMTGLPLTKHPMKCCK